MILMRNVCRPFASVTRPVHVVDPSPQRKLMGVRGDHKRTGIFFDSDNVSPKNYENIISSVKTLYNPKPSIMRAYRDGRETGWMEACERLSIEAIHVPSIPHKNSSDLYMCCDMMDLRDDLDTYVIVSNDSDFRHVMVYLRKRGKYTVVVTVNGGSKHLVKWGDDNLNICTMNRRSPDV